MKREKFHQAGRLKFITYNENMAISVGERGYARLEIQQPSAATLRRLDDLAARRYGSGRTELDVAGVIYRSPWAFLGALCRTQVFVWQAKRRARRTRKERIGRG